MNQNATTGTEIEKVAAPPLTSGILKRLWAPVGICLFLAAIIWVVFGQTLHHSFIDFDDDTYVYDNPVVSRGLTLRGVHWAFTHAYSNNWHPLTWISHMADCEFYGLDAGGHHLTNVLLHATGAILLFLVLQWMTGFRWRSAFVAAVFAIHPLRVESVAWVAERKDVLSGIFFMLTIGAYAHYARQATSLARWGTVVVLFALGLMCKPMLVTLPLILLLLDYWPLNRFRIFSTAQPTDPATARALAKHLVAEKIPLLGLSLLSSIITVFAQSGAVKSFQEVGPGQRVGNALVSVVVYLEQMFWPAKLTILYPFPLHGESLWKIILAVIILFAISASVYAARKTRPYLLVGWLWYLVMLGPVIGIFQVGMQARADRYTYLPQIGVYVALTWLVADLCVRWRQARWILGGISTAIIAALTVCAHAQTTYWQDNETLWPHTLTYTSDNFIAENDFGTALYQKGYVDEALVHFKKSTSIRPTYADAHDNLGDALLNTGSVDEAIVEFQKALELEPNFADAHNNLATTLLQKGKGDEAIIHFQAALQLKPDLETHNNLGYALLQNGKTNEAIVQFQKALDLAWTAGRQDMVEHLTAQLSSLRNRSPALEK